MQRTSAHPSQRRHRAVSLGATHVRARAHGQFTVRGATQTGHAGERVALLLGERAPVVRATQARTAPLLAALCSVGAKHGGAALVGLFVGALVEVAAARRVAERFCQGDATDPPQ